MAKKTDTNYAKLKSQLDEILGKMEDPQIDVDTAVELYKQGMETVQALEEYLQSAETKIKTIRAKFNQTDS